MKKILNLLLVSALLLPFGFAAAQEIPIDPDTRVGKLENGLTYYIKHNQKPEKKVELRLAVDAGSILEDDDQQGLAHFMEHMNFNGTKNFPDNKLVDYLQSIGVRFGADLNAYTNFDQTVYMLPVPLDKPENLKTGLKVIEDWAFNALLTDEQIDKERGVILEEWRLGLGANMRMIKKLLPEILKDSRYAERLPIGQEAILKTFPYDALRRFHRDWYRPNLMAVAVVGDINVDEVEKIIKENFSEYKNPVNERPRVIYDIPNHTETYFGSATDKEARISSIDINYVETGARKIQKTPADYNEMLVDNLLLTIINNRLQELADSPNPPFTYGYVDHGEFMGFTRNKEAFAAAAITSDGKLADGLKVVLQEIERARRFGVTQTELDRAKSEILSRYERMYNDRDKTESDNHVDEMVRHFLKQEPMPGIEWEYNDAKNFLPTVTLEQVNAILGKFIRDDNRIVTITAPEKEGVALPSEQEVLALIENVKNEKLDAYEDKVAIEQLVTDLQKSGKVAYTEKDPKLGTITWVLNNGATVIFKKTDFKNDEILFGARRKGGSSLQSDADYRATQWANMLLDEAGLNGYSKTDLTKYLAGKQVTVSPSISESWEGLTGSTTPKDLPTLMELTHAYFTGLNFDAAAYQSGVDKVSALYNNVLQQPQAYFQSEFTKYLMKNNPRFTGIVPLADDWKGQDYKKAYDFYKARFANAGDFTFFFVGNIDEAQLKTLAEKYLASLPANKAKENFKDVGYRQLYSAPDFEVKKGNDPKSMVFIIYGGELQKYDETEEMNFEALSEVIDIKMTEILREQEGGIYSAGTRATYEKVPYANYDLMFYIPTGPVQAEKMTQAALDIVKNIVENGPSQIDVDKFKEESLNLLRDNMKINATWMDALRGYFLQSGNKYSLLEREEMIKAITPKTIQAVAKKYLTDENRIIATLMPEDGWQEAAAEAAKPAEKADISAESVIANYTNALGGKAKLNAVNTILSEGTTSMMGMEMATIVKQMQPNKQYSEMTMMGMKIIQSFNGKTGYIDQMGQRMEMPAEAIAEMANEQLFDALSFDASKIQSVESQTIDGKDCYVLTDDKGEKSYFDKTTWLLYRTVKDNATETNKAYGEFDGIMFPTETVVSAQGQDITMTITKVTVNQGVTEKDFE
ncbi:MAG: insulinase family protein [Prevotellaceae bacterium]|jgi:zinc protease|nr:insulinase family protein [Prevotellaceae bacterium]